MGLIRAYLYGFWQMMPMDGFLFFHKTCSMDSGLQIEMPAATAWPQMTLLLISNSRRKRLKGPGQSRVVAS